MKSFLALAMLWSSVSSAQGKGAFEIPVSHNDEHVKDGGVSSHSQIRAKKVTCEGETYAIIYEEEWGWSSGSKFIRLCRWENRTRVAQCSEDNAAKTLRCHNMAIDHYNLSDRHEKIVDLSGTSRRQPPPRSADTFPQQEPVLGHK